MVKQDNLSLVASVVVIVSPYEFKEEFMTNEVRILEIRKLYGAYVSDMVKDSLTFKGWQIVLNPKNKELIELHRKSSDGKSKDFKAGVIHQKGLLECYVVLKRLVKNLNTPKAINAPTPTQTVKQ